MDTILIVEDDKVLRFAVKELLDGEGFMIMEAHHGKRMLEIIEKHDVDLIILDIQLPDGSGLDFISDIRRITNAPIIIASGYDDKEKKINGLALGADDYVTKPYDFEMLSARISANLRRYKEYSRFETPQEKREEKQIIQFEKWSFDRKCMQMYDDQRRSCDLTVCEFKLLDTLIKHAGYPVKREDLCCAIREENQVVTPRSIDVKITRIRKKIGDNAADPNIIKTARGVGYFFNAQKIDNLSDI